MRLTRVGDWLGTRSLIYGLDKRFDAARIIAVGRWAAHAERAAIKHISNQDLGWAPLKQFTLDEKKEKGYSLSTLVRTGTYFQNITSYTRGRTAYAGVKRQVVTEDGKSVADIAKLHEYGSLALNIPKASAVGACIAGDQACDTH